MHDGKGVSIVSGYFQEIGGDNVFIYDPDSFPIPMIFSEAANAPSICYPSVDELERLYETASFERLQASRSWLMERFESITALYLGLIEQAGRSIDEDDLLLSEVSEIVSGENRSNHAIPKP